MGAHGLADYLEAVERVEPASVPRVVSNDPDDDQVVAAAFIANARLIGSWDGDLLGLERSRESGS